ncbi:hypothetical protein GCM10012285_12940 [Streptomyces kronopolitis]|uniref:Uncharacterized protein n=1 Tax=Streptomyces kronopolitis TaxID=1612435 RepID=A0ABQ2J592_9ACTN|nr:hypothetical protein GCM10012285_12940 [Streptomyces kronopolitis]
MHGTVSYPNDGVSQNRPYGSSANSPYHGGANSPNGGDTAPFPNGGGHAPYPGNSPSPYQSAPADPYHSAPPHTPYDSRESWRGNRRGIGADRLALIIHSLADIAAGFLGLWILLYLLDANHANVFVDFVRGVANWLASWSQDIFVMKTEGLRVFFNFALPALVYLAVGHGAAAWLRRL